MHIFLKYILVPVSIFGCVQYEVNYDRGSEAGPACPLGETGSLLGHHSLRHASRASKCLFGGIKMFLPKHCRFYRSLIKGKYVCKGASKLKLALGIK